MINRKALAKLFGYLGANRIRTSELETYEDVVVATADMFGLRPGAKIKDAPPHVVALAYQKHLVQVGGSRARQSMVYARTKSNRYAVNDVPDPVDVSLCEPFDREVIKAERIDAGIMVHFNDGTARFEADRDRVTTEAGRSIIGKARK